MTTPDLGPLLSLWERGASQAPAVRALLMLSALEPDAQADDLASLSIGHRDAQLFSLRERWFGPHVECLTRCPQCAETIELGFDLDDVRIPYADPGATFPIEVDGCELSVRVPDSTDLLALDGERDASSARRRLLSRCVLEARSPQGPLDPNEWPEPFARIVGDRLGLLDPQAEVRLAIHCPNCGHPTQAPFEIENYLWVEVDSWARQLLQDIHRMAGAYGWSEADILSMSTARRQAYLDLLGS